jgi:hypothetical protein
MTGTDSRDRKLRRIVAAFDAATASAVALDAVAEIAARLSGELEAMFVRDDLLFHLAAQPHTRRIVAGGTEPDVLPLSLLELEFRVRMRQVERSLAAAAGRRQLVWRFRAVHAEFMAAIEEAGRSADLLILEAFCRPLSGLNLPAPARLAARHVPGSVLLLHPSYVPGQRVAVLYRDGAEGARLLTLAAQLGAQDPRLVRVLVRDGDLADQSTTAIDRDWPGGGTRPPFGVVPLPASARLADVLAQAQRGLAILSARDVLLADETAWTAIECASCSVLIMR